MAVALNQEIGAADLGSLSYQATPGFTGDITFRWLAYDGTEFSANEATTTLTVQKTAFVGNASVDRLLGSLFADQVSGLEGDDWLEGGAGADRLYGGTGADRFVLRRGEGADTIYDFQDGLDRLVLSGGLSFGQISVIATTTTVCRIQVGTETLATLSNVRASLISAADFVVG